MCIIFTVVNENEHLRRLKEREKEGKSIPLEVIRKMKDSYEIPSVKEGFETFVQVWVQ